ncbi:hypothetical protein [Sphingobacterium cellulitidis]|uniref:hypothetical protein n=1 Tax=Sphingobacterium cellulitidis TaxID=1768011 RepID=UPI001181BCF7|nr:hypothetical protein [Sphingobacterium cellulitidis]
MDKRTSLSIGIDKPLVLAKKTELSFDLQFKPYQQDYFGYIFRLILDDNLNIDLIYDRRQDNGKHFKLIVGDKFTDINFDIPKSNLFYKWNNLKVLLDQEAGTIVLKSANSTYRHQLNLADNKSYKLFFGFNDYKSFQSSDLPPMRIKDVMIHCTGKICNHWKLDETTGNKAKDDEGSLMATSNNPFWIKDRGKSGPWKMSFTFLGRQVSLLIIRTRVFI